MKIKKWIILIQEERTYHKFKTLSYGRLELKKDKKE